VRGPDSKALLDELGASNVVVVGDPVLLTHVPINTSDFVAGSTSRRIRIGVNCGVAAAGAWCQVLDFVAEMGRAAAMLSKRGYDIEFFAVAPEDLEGCLRARSAFGDEHIPITLLDSRNAINEISRFDLVIALKLHAGVLAACCNVPFVMLEYRPKCKDFTRSIGWDAHRLRIDEISPRDIVSAAEALLSNAPAERRHLCAVLCAMRRRFEDYCLVLDRMLSGSFDDCPDARTFGEWPLAAVRPASAVGAEVPACMP
jgi:polysaccharide pyruvyl transferase WcaK-like protein